MRRSPDRGEHGGLSAGDTLDMRALVVAHLPVLEKRARQLCRGQLDADDVVQDAILRALESRHPPRSLRDPAKVRAWFHRVVHSTFVDAVRSRRRRREECLETEPPDLPAEEPTRPPWDHITEEQLHAAVSHLSDQLRVAYRMFELEGCSSAEIAAALAIRSSTVGTRVLRARRQLRALLGPSAGRLPPHRAS